LPSGEVGAENSVEQFKLIDIDQYRLMIGQEWDAEHVFVFWRVNIDRNFFKN